MEKPPDSPIALLNRGVAAFHAGNRDEALGLFAQALLIDPESELGWLWFAAATDDPAEKRYALDRAIEINPDSIGGASRKRLLDTAPAMPNELSDIGALPLPPELADLDARPRRALPIGPMRRGRRLAAPGDAGIGRDIAAGGFGWRRSVTVLVVIAILAALAAAVHQWQQPQPNRIAVAFAGPLSGPDSRVGVEMANSAQLAIDLVNADGGIDGRQIELLRYDDEGNADIARVRAAEIAADDRALLVLGHRTSAASLAAGAVYRDAGVPAITGSATAEAVTLDNPWYFRTIFTNGFEGSMLAAYVANVLGSQTATIITTPNPYEASLATAFSAAFADIGSVKQTLSVDPDRREASIQVIVEALGSDPDPGIVVLTLLQEDAQAVLLALRRAGLEPPMIGGDALGDEEFAARFESEPEELDQPGYFTEGLYAAAPLLYDAIGGDALDFARRYRETYGSSPSWQAAKMYDAVTLALAAIADAGVDVDMASAAARREAIRNALAEINSPDVALRGLTGPLYLDATHSVPQAFSIGRYTGGLLTSALRQYRLVSDTNRDDVDADLASGRVIDVDGLLLREYAVVDIGIDINELRDLDSAAETFLADFFLWFLAPSADESLTDVFFPTATKPGQRLGDPLEERTEPDGATYRIFRVQRTFTQPFDFHDYPWDEHVLAIVVQNVALQGDDVVYVPSPSILSQSQDERLRSGSDLAEPFNRLENWDATRVFFASDATSGRSVQRAESDNAQAFVQFSKFTTEITVERNVRGFLLKNLMPLALLALVTYLALFFSPDQAGVRIGFAATSILTAAVLLETVTGQLDVGYTVAIEWGYFVYIALSAALVFINIAVERLYREKRFRAVGRLDLVARTLYPLVGLVTVLAYVARYGI
jgi:ABC-type branched-subunit amino acid transport system substrate-binding protein